MSLLTPVLHAKGLYTVADPFDLVANTAYECIAIRSFEELIQMGVDVNTSYYVTVGLSQEDYEADLAAGASIVSLAASNQPTVHIPDSYITTYPDLGTVAYKQVILSVSLGPLPDSLDLGAVKTEIASAVSDVIGLEPTVNEFVMSTPTVVTFTDADALEITRQAAITNRKSYYAKYLALQAQHNELQSQYNVLVEIVKDNDLVS